MIERGADLVHLRQNDVIVPSRLAVLVVLQCFYLDVAKVVVSREFNPDEPKGLKKLTRAL